MSTLSATHAAFAGFELIRREWRAVLVWSALRFIVGLLLAALFIYAAGDDLSRAAQVTSAAPEQLMDPNELWRVLRGLEPVGALSLVVSFALQMILVSATYRAFLDPQEHRYAFIRFGRTEFVIAAVSILMSLLYLVALLAVAFVLVLVINTVKVVAPALSSLAALIELVAFIALMVWAMVRVSLAWVDSYDRREVSLFHSLTLTRGHFWRLLGAYLVGLALILLALVIAFVAFIIVAAAAAFATGESISSIGEVFDASPANLLATFSLPLLLWLLFNAVIGACSYPLMIGPTVEAFRAYKAQGAPLTHRRRNGFHEEDGAFDPPAKV